MFTWSNLKFKIDPQSIIIYYTLQYCGNNCKMVEERIKNERNLPVLIVVSLKFAPAYKYHLVAPLFKTRTQSR